MSATKCEALTYIIAPNRLAGEYLVWILSRNSENRPILCESFPEVSSNSTLTIFVLDNSFPLLPLGECVRRLRSRFPKARFVVVGRAQTDVEIVRLLGLGVHGFVDQSRVRGTLRDAVGRVERGHIWVSNDVLRTYVELSAQPQKERLHSPAATTPRETEVLDLAMRRLSNKEIAKILRICESTVKFHISNILGKLGAGNRHDLESDLGPVRVLDKFLAEHSWCASLDADSFKVGLRTPPHVPRARRSPPAIGG